MQYNNNYNNVYDEEDDDIIEIKPENDRPISTKVDSSVQTKKKKNPFMTLCVNILSVLFLLFVAISAFSIVSYCWKDTEQQQDVVRIYESFENNFYYENGFDDETIQKMIAHVDTLPSYLKDTFYKDWVVVIDDKLPIRLTSNFVLIDNNDYDTTGLNLGGYTFTQARVIYVNSGMGNDVAYTSFVHEIGHFISFEYGSQHGSSEWIEIYEKGYNTLDVSDYDKSNEAEFFASCYQLRVTNPNKIKVYLKEADTYFAELLNTPLKNNGYVERFFTGCENTFNILRTYIRLIKY